MMDVSPAIGLSLFDTAVDHGPRLHIEGMGDVRLDVRAAIQYLLSPREDE